MLEQVDMGKVHERIQKDGVRDVAVMCLAFLQELQAFTEQYAENVKSLMRTYKDEVCLMDSVVSLSFVSYGKVQLQHNIGCGIEQGKELIIKALKDKGAEDDGEA